MELLLPGVAIAVLMLLAAAFVWWRWIKPWGELEELVNALLERRAPRRFLITSNRQAGALGRSFETLAARQEELERAASQGSLSLQSVLGALPDGLVLVDEQRRIRLMNPQFERLFRLREARPDLGLLEVVRDAAVERAVTAAQESGELRSEPMTVGRGLETRRDLEVIAVPFQAGDGASNAVVLFRDVTQVRQVEEMRRDFVANVSHELRTPLSIFRGYLETLLDDPRQSHEELVRILKVMDRHAERLTLLVEDILTLSRLEMPGAWLQLTEIYLPDFLEGIMRDWEKRFGSKLLRAKLELAEDLPIIRADEHRLQEVIYNLLDNAVKYSQPEGRITLRAERQDESVRISVADEGPGIPARDLPRIFERFYRADKARSRQLGGTGLGLSIVKHIAQLHGGSAEAASEPGRGATVGILLPLQPPASEEESSQNVEPQFNF